MSQNPPLFLKLFIYIDNESKTNGFTLSNDETLLDILEDLFLLAYNTKAKQPIDLDL